MRQLLLLVSLLIPATALAGPGDDAWKQLLSLAGKWQGTEAGHTATLTYTVISGGHALLESMSMPAPAPDMVTVYHRDGDSLVATHYCSIGNQPRMRTESNPAATQPLRFRFVDITNLKPGGTHIKHLNVKFLDSTHFDQEWISNTKDKSGQEKEEAMTFHWTRVPAK